MLYLNVRQGLSSGPNLVPVQEAAAIITDRNKDWYTSLFKYNSKHKEFVDEKGTVSGIQDTTTNMLFFDFDSKTNLEEARRDAVTVAHRLIEAGIPDDAISAHFTGSKGMAIDVSLDDTITPREFKLTVFKIAGDLKTFDRVVNDPNRIIRVSNTRHDKSGLYKIPLELWEMDELSIDEIKEMAKTERVWTKVQTKTKLPESLKVVAVEEKKPKLSELDFNISMLDLKQRPKYFDEPKWLLANGFFKTGDRNYAMLCLASTYHNQKYTQQFVKGALTGVAVLQAERTGEEQFPEKEIDLIVKQVYSENWKGGQFTTKDPTNWLALYAKKMGLVVGLEADDPMTIDMVESGFTNFVMNIKANTVVTGIAKLDNLMPITIGSNIGIVAAAGAGKTALALKILKNTSMMGVDTVFASLDMHRNRLFEKLCYAVTGLSRDDLYKIFREGRGSEVTDKIREQYGNVWFYDRSAATVGSIKEYVLEVERKTGRKIKLVMLDYFERINSDISDDTASSKKVANEIQDMLNDLNVACITLCQPNKFSLGGGPDTEIKSYTAIKGSSFLYQSFRGIISLSRPFYTPATKELDKFMIVNILKNDLGELARLEYGWSGKRGDIYELEDAELDELHELMKMKNSDKKGSDDGWS